MNNQPVSITIKPADLDAVRAVLAGHKDLAEVAEKYNNRHRLLVALTILWGTGRTTFRRGEYMKYLEALVIDSGIPAGGWPRDNNNCSIWPDWYNIHPNSLRNLSHTWGTHRTDDNHVIILSALPPRLEALLKEDSNYRTRAQELYDTANQALAAAKAAVERQQERQAALIQAIRADNRLKDLMSVDQDHAYPINSDNWLERIKAILELVAQHRPDLLEKYR